MPPLSKTSFEQHFKLCPPACGPSVFTTCYHTPLISLIMKPKYFLLQANLL
ncbi:hypothetical protein HanRHA438_Chr16g0784051 [Helianthus annuus]|nr:hypothetical protein HanRHA438_Chr16g0784051 [Helianthus annuus]